MTCFPMLDIPFDILPLIVAQLENPRQFFTCCLVNKSFYDFAIVHLYRQISVYSWHKHGKANVIRLFRTLSACPDVARHVLQLDIRDFPKGLLTENDDIPNSIVNGLRNCINLQSCSWTRDGSLTSDILRSLHELPSLVKLEINGHNQGNYNTQDLLRFTHLDAITIIMPSTSVVSTLPNWFMATGDTLTRLTIICKTSTFINDTILAGLAPHLSNLDHFYITGCPKVSQGGIWSVLSRNNTGIKGLGLEGLSPHLNIGELAQLCSTSSVLHTLCSITLTISLQVSIEQWMEDVPYLLSSSPLLEKFQIYSTGAVFESPPTMDFWKAIVSMHGEHLTRFSVHRMLIDLDSIEDICRRCPRLEELFIVIDSASLDGLIEILPIALALEVLHINFPLEAAEGPPVVPVAKALKIARHCSPRLVQLGCNTRVWQIERKVVPDKDGGLTVERSLARYSNRTIPEQFLVVRT